MASYAIKTFSGLDADDPYDTGLVFNKEIAAAKAQAALGWNVELTRTADGPATQLTVVAKDKAGQPLSGLDVTMHFFYPATRKLDRVIAASPVAEGVYAASAPLSYGHWDVEVDLKRNGERQFRTRNQLSVE
jgi:nitrogen fixation protein FixH